MFFKFINQNEINIFKGPILHYSQKVVIFYLSYDCVISTINRRVA